MPQLLRRQDEPGIPPIISSSFPVDPTDLPLPSISISIGLPSSSESDTPPTNPGPSSSADISTSSEPPPTPSASSSIDPPTQSFSVIEPSTSDTTSSLPRPTNVAPIPSANASDGPPPILNSTSESITSLTTVTTSISGTLVTFTSAITALADPSHNSDDEAGRTALIAGLTIGLVLLLLTVLAVVFALRRRTRRRQQEQDAAEKRMKEHKNLLDGEGFEDDDDPFVRSHTYPTPMMSNGSLGRPVSPTPSPIRSRASETGSIFLENVWPPPQDTFVDPIHKESSQVDLSRIVDQVMGPSGGPGHDRRPTDASGDSLTPILPQGGRRRSSDSYNASVYSDPFHHQSGSFFSQSQTSFYDYPTTSYNLHNFTTPSSSTNLPPPPSLPSMSSQTTTLHQPTSPPFSSSESPIPHSPSHFTQSTEAPRSSSPTSILSASRLSSQPKKPSPLARALSQDAKLWLSRSPARKVD